MYVSRRKRDSRTAERAETAPSMAEVQSEERVYDPQSSENNPESEPLMLERDLYLEPEDEPRGDYADPLDDIEAPPDGEDVTVPDDPQDLGDDETEADESYARFMQENTDTGVLRVQASAGGQSIPLANVNIVVYRDFDDGRHIFYRTVTNSDGVVDGMMLPAPPRINSQEGNGLSPYADYTVSASREGLRTLTVENVPIFAGVRSIQPITLSPSSREV